MGDEKKDPMAQGNSPDAEQGEADAQAEYAKTGGVTDVEDEANDSTAEKEAKSGLPDPGR